MTHDERLLPTIIGVDTGNKLIKTPSTVFHAGLDTLSARPAIRLADEMDLIRMNGQYYCVGPNRVKYERDKSLNDNYLILTLIGIAKELRSRQLCPTQEIVLSAGLPPGHLASDKLTEAYKSYFLRNGGVFRFTCGEIQHCVTIKEVVICPQAYSVLLTLPRDVIQKPSLHLIDIGGGTVDDVSLIKGKANQKMLSLDMGVIPMYNKIQQELLNQFGRKITEDQIDDIIYGTETLFSQEHINLVDSMANAHVEEIFGQFRELGADLLSSHVVFCGGGSCLLQRYITKFADYLTGAYTIVDDICANAKGFEIYAYTVLRNRGR